MEYPPPQRPPPECRCGQPASLLQSHTERNPNRWFFKCATTGCNYFKWADELPPGNAAAGPNQHHQQPQQQQQQHEQSPSQALPHYSERPVGQHQQQHYQQQHNTFSPADGGGGDGGVAGPGWGYADGGGGGVGGGGYQGGIAGLNAPPGPQQQQQQWGQQQQQWGQQPQQQWGGGGGGGGGPQGGSQGGSQPQQHPQQQWSQQPQQQWPQQQWPQQQWSPQQQQQQQQHRYSQPQQQWSQGGSQGAAAAAGGGGGGPFNSPACPNLGQQQQPSWAQQSPQQQQHYQQQQQHGWPPSPQQQQQPPFPHPTGAYNSPQQQQQQHTPQHHNTTPGGGAAPGGSSAQRGVAGGSAAAPSPSMRVVRVVLIESDPEMVGLKTAGFDQFFVDSIKETPYADTARRWDKDNKMWRVRHTSLDAVVRHLTAKGFRLLMPGQDTPARGGGGSGDTPGGGAGTPFSQGAQQPPVDLQALESSNACLIPLEQPAVAAALVSSHIPDALWASLLPHQQQGVLAGVRRGGRLLIADEMGLGKSAQAIILAACFPNDWPLLVVCPTSLLSNWEVELEAWLPPALRRASDGRPHTLTLRSDKDRKRLLAAGLPQGPHILLSTYKLVQSLPTETLARYNVVICDESHKLKNPATEQSMFVGRVVRGARRAFLLTGTPLLSKPIEAWAQVDMLRPHFFGTYDEYGKKYCLNTNTPLGGGSGGGSGWGRGGAGGFKPQYSGANPATAAELHQLLLANVMVRRTKGQSGVQLPQKTRLRVSVPVSAESQPRLAAIWSDMEVLRTQGCSDTPAAQHLVNQYRQATGEAKVEGVVEFVRGLPGLTAAVSAGGAAAAAGGGASGGGRSSGSADGDDDSDSTPAPEQQAAAAAAAGAGSSSAAAAAAGVGDAAGSTRNQQTATAAAAGGGKVLVFAHHQGVLDAIQSRLCEADRLGYVRIDGRTSGTDRQAAVLRFQTDPAVRLALMSIKAGGVGLTLTAADTVVFAELDWNPTDLQQCEDRIHRVGQQQHCRIYYCVAADSADSIMWRTLARKLRVVGATVDGLGGEAGAAAAQGLQTMQYWEQVGSSQQTLTQQGLTQTQPQTQQSLEEEGGGQEEQGHAEEGGDGQQQQQHDRGARRSLFTEFVMTGRMPGEGADGAGGGGGDGGGATHVRHAAAAGTQHASAPAAGVSGGSGSGAEQQQRSQVEAATTAADATTAAESHEDWVLLDAAEALIGAAACPPPPPAAAAPGTQGSQSLVESGATQATAAAAAGGDGGGGVLVSVGRPLQAVCAGAGHGSVQEGEAQEATGSAPDADNPSSPPEDPATKRQRQC